MSEETWECNLCHATARIDVDATPKTYHSKYPADTGPYSDRPMPHDCPIKKGLLPEQLETAPNAKRVA